MNQRWWIKEKLLNVRCDKNVWKSIFHSDEDVGEGGKYFYQVWSGNCVLVLEQNKRNVLRGCGAGKINNLGGHEPLSQVG